LKAFPVTRDTHASITKRFSCQPSQNPINQGEYG
jgi:hypothetical protein